MADADVELGVEINTDDAIKSLNALKKSTDTASSAMASSFNAIKTAAAAALAFVAGREVIQFFSDGIKAANAQEKAMAQLGNQLKLTGSFSQDALNDFADFADQMELTTTYGDDLVISQLALAKSFGLSNSQSKDLVKAATELSAVTGDSLQTSVETLGKTYDGITGKSPALKNALAGISKEALQSGAGIQAVLDKFKGSAISQINTFSGAILQAENAFGNLKEAIGKIIIENPLVIGSIKTLTDSLRSIQKIVEDNQDSIASLISSGINILASSINASLKALSLFESGMKSVSSAVDKSTKFFDDNEQAIKAFGIGLATTAAILTPYIIATNISAIAAGASAAATAVQTIAMNAYAIAAGIASTAAGIFNAVLAASPVVLAAAAIGALTAAIYYASQNWDLITEKVSNFSKEIIQKTLPVIQTLANGLASFGFESGAEKINEYIGKLDEFSKSSQGIQKAAEETKKASVEIQTANAQVVSSTKATADARDDAGRRAVASAEDLKKYRDQAVALEAEITANVSGEIGKVLKARQDYENKIQESLNNGGISAQKAAELREAIEKNLITQLESLRQKADDDAIASSKKVAEELKAATDKLIEDAKRKAEEMRAAVQAAASDPITFIVKKAEIQPSNIDKGTAENVGAGVGLLANSLEGAAGAKSLISAGAGAFADAFIPGIGGAVGSIVGKLTEGPEATKAFIKDFIDAIPTMIEAVADSIPVVVDALVENLITKGGIIKIAVALAKGMISIIPGVGKALAKGIFGSFNPSNVGSSIGTKIFDGAKKLFEIDKAIRNASIAAAQAIFTAIVEGAKKLFEFDKKIREASIEMAQNILNGIVQGAQKLFEFDTRLREAAIAAATSLYNGIVTAAQRLFEFDTKIREAFTNAASSIYNAIINGATGIFNKIKEVFSVIKLPKLPDFEVPSWVIDFEKYINKFSKPPGWLNDLTNSIDNIFKTPGWIKSLESLIKKIPTSISIGGKGGGSGIIPFKNEPTATNPLGFAEGGLVPSGFNDDSFPAWLTSGERVITVEQNRALENFLANQVNDDGESMSKEAVALLSQMVAILNKPQTISTEIKIDSNTLAKAMLNLNRRNARTA